MKFIVQQEKGQLIWTIIIETVSFLAIDMILMDIWMPVMDGLEAAQEIHRLKRTDAESVPIIAMTANTFDTDRKESEEAGMNAHLTKLLIPDKMYHMIAEALR